MNTLLTELAAQLSFSFLPHYKEDSFRTLFVGVAFRNGWTVVEPRPGDAIRTPKGEVAVYYLQWKLGEISARPAFAPRPSVGKPDTRLFSPTSVYYEIEIKCGFSGSASESNSNSTKIANDVDMVADRDRDMFLGVFDEGMLDRIQGGRSSAGRGYEVRSLLGGTTIKALHAAEATNTIMSSWRATPLKTTLTPFRCAGGIPLALLVVRKASADF